jgi:broad specificity phosphatase PhoE
MNVYLIRHGQTEGNLQGYHQGWGNVALTETGVAQAEELQKSFAGKKIDRIISSDLNRARQTCSIIFGDRESGTIEYDARLREINNSVLEGKKRDEMYRIWGRDYIENCYKLDFSAYGGESAQSMLDRTADFLRDLEKDISSENIAVVTHGGTIHAILSNILKMPLYTPLLRIDNCSVTKLKFKDGLWSVSYINKTVKRTTE